MASSSFYQMTNGQYQVKTVAEGYTSIKPVRRVIGFVNLAGFAGGCQVLEADQWEKDNLGAVAVLEVSRGKDQAHPLHEVRTITRIGKTVLNWVDGNEEAQSSRMLAASSITPEEAYFPYEVTRYEFRLSEGEVVEANF